jgi:hypothetical protein
MIHDIVIWKLVLAGFVLACGSFILGFIIACVLAASGRASRMEEEMESGLLKITRPGPWPDPPGSGGVERKIRLGETIHIPKGMDIDGGGRTIHREGKAIIIEAPIIIDTPIEVDWGNVKPKKEGR